MYRDGGSILVEGSYNMDVYLAVMVNGSVFELRHTCDCS